MMKLFCSTTSPYTRKVTICAELLGLTNQIERIVVSTTAIKPSEMLAKHNPMIKVPTLILDNGEVLYDSRVICEYLASVAKDNQIFPVGESRWKALTLQATADGLLDAGVGARYEMALRPKEYQWDGWFQAQMKKVVGCLDVIEANISSLSGSQLTIAEIAIACALGFLDFRVEELNWRQQYPKTAAWFEQVSHLSAIKNSVPVNS